MISRVVRLSLLLLLCSMAAVQSNDVPFERFPQALGVQVGRVAGVGLSYQNWDSRFGYQIAAGGLYHPTGEDGQDLYIYNVGVETLYQLFSDDFSTWLSGRLYAVAGVNHRGFRETVDDGFNAEFAIGGGIGVEAALFEHFAIATEMVYALLWKPVQPVVRNQFSMEMLPQVSIRYRF